MPASIAASRSPKRACTQSRSRKRETRKASVAPTDEAKETISVPHHRPNTAPAGQRHQRRAGQRQRGDRHVDREVKRGRQPRLLRAKRLDGRLLRLQRIEAQVAAEVEGEEQPDGGGDDSGEQNLAE